jgi:hypothetical protein
VHRDAGRLADGEQAGDDRVRIAVAQRHDFTPIIGRDSAHIIVDGRHDRQRLAGETAGEDLAGFGYAGKPLARTFYGDMVEVEEDVVLLRPDAAAFADLSHVIAAHAFVV